MHDTAKCVSYDQYVFHQVLFQPIPICKTFSIVPLPLTCPSRTNLTQTHFADAHTPTSNLYYALEVTLDSFSLFSIIIWASKTHDGWKDALVTTGKFSINFCSNQSKCAKRSTMFHSHSHIEAESISHKRMISLKNLSKASFTVLIR